MKLSIPIAVVVVLALSCPYSAFAGADTVPGDEANRALVRFLLVKTDEARARLSPVSFRLTARLSSNKPEGGRTKQSTAEVYKDGNNEWTRVAHVEEDHVMYSLVTDRLLAVWVQGTANPQVIEHPSRAEMSERGKAMIMGFQPPNLILHATGSGTSTLRTEVEKNDEPVPWQAVERVDGRGRTVFDLRHFAASADGTKRVNMEYTIDPDADFTVAKVTAFLPDGRLGMEAVLTYERVNNRFFPKTFERRIYGAWVGAAAARAGDVVNHMMVDVTDVRVGEPVDPGRFTLRTFGMDERRVSLALTKADGSNEAAVLVGDGYVPLRLTATAPSTTQP